MAEYYHYTTEATLNDILRTGMWSNHPLYTTNRYYNTFQAGQAVGVMPHNIDIVLLFKDDGLFKLFNEPVPSTGRFTGGASQYSHPGRIKPIAKRRLSEMNWTSI